MAHTVETQRTIYQNTRAQEGIRNKRIVQEKVHFNPFSHRTNLLFKIIKMYEFTWATKKLDITLRLNILGSGGVEKAAPYQPEVSS
jgi:hypothetical protein